MRQSLESLEIHHAARDDVSCELCHPHVVSKLAIAAHTVAFIGRVGHMWWFIDVALKEVLIRVPGLETNICLEVIIDFLSGRRGMNNSQTTLNLNAIFPSVTRRILVWRPARLSILTFSSARRMIGSVPGLPLKVDPRGLLVVLLDR